MKPGPIIESFLDEGENVAPGVGPRRILTVINEFRLKSVKEALHRCIVEAVGFAAHRCCHAGSIEGGTISQCDAYWADSSGRRNIGLCSLMKQRVKRLCGRSPAECLSRSGIEVAATAAIRRRCGRSGRCLLGVLPQKPIGILVGAALPWASRIAEVDLDTGVDFETIVLAVSAP